MRPASAPKQMMRTSGVVFAVILDLQGVTRKHECGVGKIQTPFCERLLSLGWIEGHFHGLL